MNSGDPPYQEIQRHTKIESEWEENRPERREIERETKTHRENGGRRRGGA